MAINSEGDVSFILLICDGLGPKRVLWVIHNIYPAASTTPEAEIMVAHFAAGNAPIKTRISETNPLVDGSPSAANPASIKIVLNMGIFDARPPKSGIYRVWVR